MEIQSISGAPETTLAWPPREKRSVGEVSRAGAFTADAVEPIREESVVVLVRSISELLRVEIKEAGSVPPVHAWLVNL